MQAFSLSRHLGVFISTRHIHPSCRLAYRAQINSHTLTNKQMYTRTLSLSPPPSPPSLSLSLTDTHKHARSFTQQTYRKVADDFLQNKQCTTLNCPCLVMDVFVFVCLLFCLCKTTIRWWMSGMSRDSQTSGVRYWHVSTKCPFWVLRWKVSYCQMLL